MKPSTYAEATNMPRDAETCLDFARLTWNDLGVAERRVLVGLDNHSWRSITQLQERTETVRRLMVHGGKGLVEGTLAHMRCTPLGWLVREAGARTRLP